MRFDHAGRAALAVTALAVVAAGSTEPRAQTTPLPISGTVVDEAGRPVPGAWVTAWSRDVQREAASTASGDFQITDLPAGTYTVTATLAWFASDAVPLQLGATPPGPLRLTLRPRYGGEGAVDVQERLQRAYNEARDRWRARSPTRYQFTVEVHCYCGVGRRKMSFMVVEGRATAVVQLSAAETRFYTHYDTIDKLLAIVRNAVAIRPFSMAASFDPEFGFPSSVSVNPNGKIFDEELRFSVTAFKALPPG
jgi:hypothetical protein